MRARFLTFWLAIICFLTMAAQGNARDCPPPEQRQTYPWDAEARVGIGRSRVPSTTRYRP